MRTRGTLAGLVIVVILTGAVTPTGAVDASATDVTVLTETFVDETRASPASGFFPAVDTRTFVTTVAIPAGKPRPRPLVVLAHGHNGNPGKFTELIGDWAAAGYVVAAPLFPRSSDLTGGSVRDVVEQPADVSFVIDEMLRLAKTKGSPLRRHIDPKRIGVAGLSLGGWTTYRIAFHPCCLDRRVDAVILMSAIRGGFDGGEYDFRELPALLVHGNGDPLYAQSAAAYPELSAPKWFVTLPGVGHAEAFEDTPAPSDQVARDITTAFWDRYLLGERDAATRLVTLVDESGGQATLERELR